LIDIDGFFESFLCHSIYLFSVFEKRVDVCAPTTQRYSSLYAVVMLLTDVSPMYLESIQEGIFFFFFWEGGGGGGGG
jgi:hypothetical protein